VLRGSERGAPAADEPTTSDPVNSRRVPWSRGPAAANLFQDAHGRVDL